MKKLLTIFATFAMLCAVGCEEQGGGDNVNPNDKPNEDIPENIFFGLDKESVTISPDGGSVDVIVYSNYKWEISGASDWCTPSVKSGEANEDGQKVSFSANVTYDDREATFWFRCANEKIKFTVSQSLKEVFIADENNTFSVPAEGGNVILNYKTTVECEVVIPEEAKSWITIAPADATRGLVAESVKLDVAENTTYSARSAVVKVVKVGDNTLFAEYTINQVQNDAIIADENNTFNLKGWAQSINIAYKTNVECEVIIPEEAKSWITLAPATRALVNESATLNIAENYTGAERSAVVKVVAANNNELFAEYTITQAQRYYIEYTSTDGSTIIPYSSDVFGATIIRNEYTDGKGYIEFDAPVTSIGSRTFQDCTSLASVTIPDSVTSIGYQAFYKCTSLTSFYGKFASEDGKCLIVDNVLKAFAIGCNLAEYTIPDSVTLIGYGAFADCKSLTSVTIPDSVTEIRNWAFEDCTSLTSITIPDSVTSIGDHTFEDCTSLTSITIPDSVTSIGDHTFEGCTSLTSITIPDSITEIGERAFAYCYSLTSVTIPDSVTEIGDYAFYACTGELIINSKIVETDYIYETYHSQYGWLRGAKFSKLTIGNGVTSIGDHTFEGCSSLTSITIPDSVTEIGEWAFSGCSSLTSITIPDSVTEIGEWAFSGCKSLTSITIPDSVTSIGYQAFYKCTSLTSITIPESVTSIGELAFAYCYSLTSVYCKPTTPPTGGSYMFDYNASGRKIYVPTQSVKAYKSASYWSDYASYIVGYDF